MYSKFAVFVSGGACLTALSIKKIYCEDAPDYYKQTGLASGIGNTPLVFIRSLSEATKCEIYAKAEYHNASGSIKDRAALGIILEAERSNKLNKGGTIVEGTGGNTGIALAQIGASKGYKVILCMPNCIAVEKINYSKRFGAEVGF